MADTPYVDASKLSGKRFAVESLIWFKVHFQLNINKLATTSTPPCPALELLPKIKSVHTNLSQSNITLMYVFDGTAPPHKDATKKQCVEVQEHPAAAKWIELCECAKKEANITVDATKLKEATDAQMKMSHPTVVDHGNILRWMKENNIECIGSIAIAKADQQMIKLERKGLVDRIITEDSDLVALGAKRIICKMSRKNNGKFQ